MRFAQVYLPERIGDATAPFHHELLALAAQAQAERTGAIIATPRGHSKSTLLSFIEPLHAIAYQRHRCIVLISNTHYLSASLVRDLRLELEQNDLLRQDFGDLRGPKWGDSAFETRTDIRVTARSVGSQLRGTKHREQRPTLIILDDAEKDEHCRTLEQRTKIADWFHKVVLPALDPKAGTVLVVGTILHFDSLLANLLKQGAVYRTAVFRTDEQAPLWPERYDAAWLARERARIGSLAFNSEYRNDPTDSETQIFKPQWWQWYTKDQVRWDEVLGCWVWRDLPLTLYMGVDPAISLKESADFTALVTVGITPDGRVLVLEARQERLDFPSQVDRIIERADFWRPRTIGIEVIAYQAALREQVLVRRPDLPVQGLQGERAVERPLGLGGDLARHVHADRGARPSKELRLAARSLLVERGLVHLREALPHENGTAMDELGGRRVHHSAVDFYQQSREYPRSAHDDLLDAFDGALAVAARPPGWRLLGALGPAD